MGVGLEEELRLSGTPVNCDFRMESIEKSLNEFFNSGSLKAVIYRANAIFSFATKVLATLAGCCWVSTAFMQPMTVPDIVAQKVYVVKGEGSGLTGARDYYDGSQNDQGFIDFDLNVDIQPLFNWNVKVVFLYLTVDYSTDQSLINTAVVWDKIIMAGEPMQLDLKKIKTKYYFRDTTTRGGLLNNQNVTLTLHWNVMPNMGHMSWLCAKGEGQTQISFPSEYYAVRKGGRGQ